MYKIVQKGCSRADTSAGVPALFIYMNKRSAAAERVKQMNDKRLQKGPRKKPATYDSAFRTMLEKMSVLILPVINEVFETNYPLDSKIIQCRNEHHTLRGEKITDSLLQIGNKHFHFEFQCGPNRIMAIRMLEYDMCIAIENKGKENGTFKVIFPKSCVIYLRNSKSAPKTLRVMITMPSGEKTLYECPVVNVIDYTKDDIFSKNLIFLLPFYIIRYEKTFNQISKRGNLQNRFLDELKEIMERLRMTQTDRFADGIYNDLFGLMKDVIDYELSDYEDLKEGADAVMGGYVLELQSEKQARKEKEKICKAKKQGREEGLIELVKEGLIDAKVAAGKLGVSEAEIEERIRKM